MFLSLTLSHESTNILRLLEGRHCVPYPHLIENTRHLAEMDRVRMVTLVLLQYNPPYSCSYPDSWFVSVPADSRAHGSFGSPPISDYPAWVDRDAVDVSSHTIVRHLYPYWAKVEM